MQGVVWSVEIVGIDPAEARIAVGNLHLSGSHLVPALLALLVIAEPADHEYHVVPFEIVAHLLDQPAQAGFITVRTALGVRFTLHPDEGDAVDSLALGGLLDL